MRVSERLAVILGIMLATAGSGFAQGNAGAGTDGAVLRATNESPAPAAASAEPAPTPAPAPQGRAGASGTDDTNAAATRLIPTTAGPLGLFTLETGDVLSRHDWSVVGYVNKFSRMPGSATVLNLGFNFGYGLTDWLNLYAGFEPYRHTHVSNPAQLSLRLPGALPIFSNLPPGASPAYIEDYPFASTNDGGVGEFTIGGKLGLLSQRNGHPLSLSLRDELIIPTRTSLTDLLGNGTQTGKLSDLLSMAVSRNWSNAVTLSANVGARFGRELSDGGVHLLDNASQVRLGAGFILLPQNRIQFMNEYTSVVFAGNSTPNQSFGARDPLDGVWGVRLFPADGLGIDLGYRYMLNLGNARDRNGFVIKMGYAHHPAPPPPPANRSPSAACSVNPAAIIAGSADSANVTANASDPDGDALVYSWSATAGTVEGAGAQVRWVPGNLGPGNYRVNMTVSDNRGGTASCSAEVRIDPRPNRPPTVTVTADRPTVLVGERVGFRANCTDPDNDQVTYTWRTNGGQIVGTGAAIQLDTTGLAPGTYTVTVRCEDGKGGAADATATVQVQAPPPPPMASKLSQCDFRAVNSSRIDNVCKRVLDDVALRLQNDPRATVVIVGFADPRERRPDTLAGTRATNAVNYLAMDRGIDRTRTSTRTGSGQAGAGAANRHIDIIWVPEGATY